MTIIIHFPSGDGNEFVRAAILEISGVDVGSNGFVGRGIWVRDNVFVGKGAEVGRRWVEVGILVDVPISKFSAKASGVTLTQDNGDALEVQPARIRLAKINAILILRGKEKAILDISNLYSTNRQIRRRL